MLPFERELALYPLNDRFSLVKADELEFIRAWVAYQGSRAGGFNSLSDMKGNLAGVPFLYWLHKDDRAIAGLVMLPNALGDLFLIPPQSDCGEVMDQLWPLLNAWSDDSRSIQAQMIADNYKPALAAHGFEIKESMRRMIRPVTPISHPSLIGYAIVPLTEAFKPQLPTLLHNSFQGNPGEHGSRGLEGWENSVNNYFQSFDTTSPAGRASFVAKELANDQIASFVLSDILDGLTTFRFIGTLPEHRRQNLATALIAKALEELAESEDWVQLAVTVGNPAEHLYQNLGFVGLPLTHNLERAPAASIVDQKL